MRILIVGNGGREHALLWKLLRDAPDAEFFATRPTPGMAPMCEAVEIAPTDVEALADWATSHRIDLTVVGPEGPLAAGHRRPIPVQGTARLRSDPGRGANRVEQVVLKELSCGTPTYQPPPIRPSPTEKLRSDGCASRVHPSW